VVEEKVKRREKGWALVRIDREDEAAAAALKA
jgi:hypothetical protein